MKTEFDVSELKKSVDSVTVRKLSDMKERFENTKGVDMKKVAYRVYIGDFGAFEYGLTVIEPGTVNGEFFMTMGHKHSHPSKELYILLSGSGKLVLQDTKHMSIQLMKKDKFYIIPPNSWHRLVNVGAVPLEVLTIYPKNAGHDYKFKYREVRVKKR